LGAVLTGEQGYYQKFATFTDVADTTDPGLVLGVDLGEVGLRWWFTVTDASVDGFVASAQGRAGTEAEGFVVTLTYVRGQPPKWRVHRSRTP
jgi:hypothetical protein